MISFHTPSISLDVAASSES